MKLGTYKDGSRDGQLVVVSRDLKTAHYASGIAGRLQQVLDDWNFVSPQLEDLYTALNGGKARHAFAFDPARCMAPLPRADPWLELLGPRDDIVVADVEWGVDFEAQVAVVTGDVALGTPAERAVDAVRLVMLANDIHLRHLPADEAADRSGLVPSRPASAFSAVAVTPDELGAAWRGGRAGFDLERICNGRRIGRGNAGEAMPLHFGELIAHRCRTRSCGAGSIVGSGIVGDADGAAGARSLQFGDTVRVEARGAGAGVFGAIEQTVRRAARGALGAA